MGELCAYSGHKIPPGKGRTLIKSDGKTFKFINGRCHKAHLLRRNPRKVTWTVLYRRKHRKGIEEETSKKRTKKTQRDQAIRAAKETKKTTKTTTKKPAASAASAAQKKAAKAQKATKNVQKSAPKVGGKR